MDNSIGLRMLGSEAVCNEIMINRICKSALHIRSVQDISNFSKLRPQFYQPMFDAICAVTGKTPNSVDH